MIRYLFFGDEPLFLDFFFERASVAEFIDDVIIVLCFENLDEFYYVGVVD
jgi:hypothetical protein